MNERLARITDKVIAAMRDVIREEEVTRDEYDAAVEYLERLGDAGQISPLMEVFLTVALCDVENSKRQGSYVDVQGPFFIPDTPYVPHGGRLKVFAQDANAERMHVAAKVQNLDGVAIPDAKVEVWHSTADGEYSGVHVDIPEYTYRGHLITTAAGAFAFDSITPVPYCFPKLGPLGELFDATGKHTWRPAHIHLMIEAAGFKPYVTQVYFKDGKYVGDDSTDAAQIGGKMVMPSKLVDGVRHLDLTFELDPV